MYICLFLGKSLGEKISKSPDVSKWGGKVALMTTVELAPITGQSVIFFSTCFTFNLYVCDSLICSVLDSYQSTLILASGTILSCKFEPPRGKTNNVVSEQVQHKPACTSKEKS